MEFQNGDIIEYENIHGNGIHYYRQNDKWWREDLETYLKGAPDSVVNTIIDSDVRYRVTRGGKVVSERS